MEWPTNCVKDGVATLDCLPVLFGNVVTSALALSGAVALILIVYSGIKFITSGGDAKEVEGARKILTYAVIGLIVILLAYFIVNVIANITGVECIKQFGFNSCK